MNDLIQLCMVAACRKFNHPDLFNAACFSQAFARAVGTSCQLDGKVVAGMLCGRDDVAPLSGGSHYKLLLPHDVADKAYYTIPAEVYADPTTPPEPSPLAFVYESLAALKVRALRG